MKSEIKQPFHQNQLLPPVNIKTFRNDLAILITLDFNGQQNLTFSEKEDGIKKQQQL